MASAASGSRYDVLLKLASGGMATVYIGQVRGALGFRQLVAIKRPHAHLLDDASFRTELVAEARLASMIRHANVVDVRDVEITGDSIDLVMDYIEGASLGELLVAAGRDGGRLAPRAVVRIALDACAGLHAAHELVDERGRPVGLVHRDVSPQNILVGIDGMARVVDFGVAKFARKNLPSTSGNTLKGKLAYMPPEYVRGETIDRRFDVFAMGVVLWEGLTGRRCFRGANEVETLKRVVDHVPDPPSKLVPGLPPALDDVVATALAKDPEERFQNAAAMAAALERTALDVGLLGGASDVVAAVKAHVGTAIEERRTLVRAKLAHEPSVASLMNVPPLVAEQVAAAVAAAAPDTEPAAPPAVARVATPSPSTTEREVLPVASEPRDVIASARGGAMAQAGATLPSAPPLAHAAQTAQVAPETTVASYTLVTDGEPTPTGPMGLPRPGARPAWVVPVLAFGAVLAVTVTAGTFALRRTSEAAAAAGGAATATSGPSLGAPPTASVPAPPSTSAEPPAVVSAGVAPAAPAPSPSHAVVKAGARPAVRPAATTKPAPPPIEPSSRRPPENPYR